jgi:prevent-host-death family protein
MLRDRQPITEVPATELARKAASVLARVEKGERVIVTRHGHAVAVLVSVWTGVDLVLAGSERFTLLRREAREELEAGTTKALAEWRVGWFVEGRDDEPPG